MNSQASSSSTLAPDVASSSVPPEKSYCFLPPGFRFHPTEQELILYYLGRKAFGEPLYTNIVPDIEIYKFEPHEVPGKVGGDIEWYFFSKLDKKYDTGVRVNRSTERGFWKVTGPEYKIKYGSHVIGEKRFLVYYDGHSKMGRRTDWVMHEYRLTDATLLVAQPRDVHAVYKLFWKGNSPIPNGPAPVAAEEGEQVHNDSVVPADVALQPLEALGTDEEDFETVLAEEGLEVAPAAFALLIHKEAPAGTRDLLTNFDGEGLSEHSEETLSEREDTPTRPVKRPKIEVDSPQNLSPRTQEPNSSNSVAGATPSLKLSLACLASETAPEQQQRRQIAMPQPVPQQAVEPPQTTSVQTAPEIRITIQRETIKRETSED